MKEVKEVKAAKEAKEGRVVVVAVGAAPMKLYARKKFYLVAQSRPLIFPFWTIFSCPKK